jgi:hypothetical protein
VGNARNFPGPIDARYQQEWARQPDQARRPFFEPGAPASDVAAAAQANWQLQFDILMALSQHF